MKQEEFNKIIDLRPHLLHHPDAKMVEASCVHYLGDGPTIKLGDYVCPKEDKGGSAPAIVVYDHSSEGLNSVTIKWASDGLISLREKAHLRKVEPLVFMKVWCEKQITYREKPKT